MAFTPTQDLQVAVAGASEVVRSPAAMRTVKTTDQQLSTLISQQKIQALPLLSRDPNALILLAPGTIDIVQQRRSQDFFSWWWNRRLVKNWALLLTFGSLAIRIAIQNRKDSHSRL